MDSIEKKLRTTREFADMYVEELQKIQEELRKAGDMPGYYDVAAELVVIYAERLEQALPKRGKTRHIEIVALQELLEQVTSWYPEETKAAQDLRGNMGALRMMSVAEKCVKDKINRMENDIRVLSKDYVINRKIADKYDEALLREKGLLERLDAVGEQNERLQRERKHFQRLLWETGEAKREERRRKREAAVSACPVVTPYREKESGGR